MMISKTWQEIEEGYQSVPESDTSLYSVNARLMLKVLPKIRMLPELENARHWLSHFCLNITFAGKDARIEVWGDTDNTYMVWLQRYPLGRIKEAKVGEEALIPTILEYLNYL